jgi:hypothetical protein
MCYLNITLSLSSHHREKANKKKGDRSKGREESSKIFKAEKFALSKEEL